MSPYARGGMETHTLELATELQKYMNVTVLLPQLSPEQQGQKHPFEVVFLPWDHSRKWLLQYRSFSKEVATWLAKHPCELVFSQGFAAYDYLKQKKVPVIVHPHGLEMLGQAQTIKEQITFAIFKWIARQCFQKADCVISLGGQLTDMLRQGFDVADKKIKVIPNATRAMNLTKTEWSPCKNRFLFVGRLAFNKGLDFLPEVMNLVNIDSFSLSIVGDGPLRSSIENLSKSDPRVVYKGRLGASELRSEFENHRAILFMSRFEGMPTVILEAMSYGLCVVATRIGAVDTMLDPSTGILVEPSAKSISDGILRYSLMSDVERKTMAQCAQQKVKSHFTWEHVTQSYRDLFHEFVS